MVHRSPSEMEAITENLLESDHPHVRREDLESLSDEGQAARPLDDLHEFEYMEMAALIPYADEEDLTLSRNTLMPQAATGHVTGQNPQKLRSKALKTWQSVRSTSIDGFGLLQALMSDDFDACISSANAGRHRYGRDRVTPLIIASLRCSHRIVKAFLDGGVNPEDRDRCGRLALLTAAACGRSESVKELLSRGADPNAVLATSDAYSEHSSKEDEEWYKKEDEFMKESNFKVPTLEGFGRMALHFAVEANSLDCVEALLENKGSADGKDCEGITPLMLAGEKVDTGDTDALDTYERIVQVLITKGADARANHEKTGRSALLRAAQLGSTDSLRLLLEKGADPNWRSNGKTALHIAAENAAKSATPSHSCISTLLSYGADLCAEDVEEVSALEAILVKVSRPIKFLNRVLDEQVTLTSDVGDNNCQVRVNFRAMCPVGEDGQDVVLHALLEGEYINKWMRYEIFRHPYPKSFVTAKWRGLRYFFYFYVGVYVVHVLFLSIFATLAHSNVFHFFDNDRRREMMQNGLPISRIFVTITAFFVLVNVGVMCFVFRRRFPFSIEMLRIVIGSVLSIIVSFLTLYDGDLVKSSGVESAANLTDTVGVESTVWGGEAVIPTSPTIVTLDSDAVPTLLSWTQMHITQSVVLHGTAVAIFLAWLELMLLIGRFPWAADALLFTAVLKNVLRVLVTYGFMIVGFAFVFFLEFRILDKDAFGDPWRSLVKTVVMMTGEFDYMDIFSEEGEGRVGSEVPWLGRCVFLFFVVLAPIALMNLMLGLAVSDTQDLDTESSERQLMKLAESVVHWEFVVLALESLCQCGRLKDWLTRCRTVPEELAFPLSMKKVLFPRDIMKSLATIAVKNREEARKPGSTCVYSAAATSDKILLRTAISKIPDGGIEILESIRKDIAELKELRREVAEIKELLDQHFGATACRRFPRRLSHSPTKNGKKRARPSVRRSLRSKRDVLDTDV